MLGKTKTAAPAAETQGKIGTIIGPGAVFDGNLSAPETIRVDGKVNGNCTCQGNLIIGTEGQIQGNIAAQNVIVSGKVDGDIISQGKLELFSTGRVVGNITAKSLVIDENAYFDGRCTMAVAVAKTAAPMEKPASPAAKPAAPAAKPAPQAAEPVDLTDEGKYDEI